MADMAEESGKWNYLSREGRLIYGLICMDFSGLVGFFLAFSSSLLA